MNHSLGRSGIHLTSIASMQNSEDSSFNSENRVELYIESDNSKECFEKLYEDKENIEKEIGKELTWYNADSVKSCRIYVRKSADIWDESKWKEQFKWLRENLELFDKVFRKRVRKL